MRNSGTDAPEVVTLGKIGRHMCEGEYESLKAIYAISPSFVPQPYAWGKLEGADETYFLLAAFRDVGEQVSVLHHGFGDPDANLKSPQIRSNWLRDSLTCTNGPSRQLANSDSISRHAMPESLRLSIHGKTLGAPCMADI